MQKIKRIYALMLACLLYGSATFAQALDDKGMAAYMAAMTPGEEQAWIAKMAGNWTFTQKSWEDPAAEASVSNGEAHSEMILGGRFLSEVIISEAWGMPFEGRNTLAYDNITGQYMMSWIDNMGTAIMNGTGSRSNNTLTMTCTYPDAVTKKPLKFRLVTTVIDDNNHRFEMYCPDKKGKEFKMMEIVYTRS